MMRIMSRVVIFLVFLSGVTELFAQTTSAENAAVITLSGRQRMLSQKIAKETLFIALDVNKEKNLELLGKTSELFSTTLKGMNLSGLKKSPTE